MSGLEPPPTRWELAGPVSARYGETFGRLVAEHADLDGEARLADALVPRGARILDAGSGMGRVGAALRARGHQVTAVEKDPALVAQSRRTYPELTVIKSDLLGLDEDALAEGYGPAAFDLVVLVGNVIVLVADRTERLVLSRMGGLLAPEGRLLVGFHPHGGPPPCRDYDPQEFIGDAQSVGLVVDLRLGSYDLRPPNDDYVVFLLSRNPPPSTPEAGSAG